MSTSASGRGVLCAQYSKATVGPSMITSAELIPMTLGGGQIHVRFLLNIPIPDAAPLDMAQVIVDGAEDSTKHKAMECLVNGSGSEEWGFCTLPGVHERLAAGLRALCDGGQYRVVEAVTMTDGRVERVQLRGPTAPDPVFGAATRGELPHVRDALSRGVSPNSINEDGVPLIQMPIMGRKLAADEGRPVAEHLRVLSLLIEQGADLKAADSKGWTAVHTACFCNDREALALLLKAGADAGARDGQGWTGLHYAAVHGHRQILDAMLAAGVDVNAISASGNTPLRIAVEQGQRELAGVLLARGADPNQTDHKGMAPLHAAALRDDAEVVRLLIRHGANPSLRSAASPKATALHLAASRGADTVVKALLDGGADTHMTDDAGNTAADVARKYQQEQTASLLAEWTGRPASWLRRLLGR